MAVSGTLAGTVVAVARDAGHRFSKQPVAAIDLVAGHGVDGDAHAGRTVQHRSRVAVDPGQPNLRQVHLISTELLDQLARAGFPVEPGDLGENILTCGLALLSLPRGTRLRIGADAVLEVTGLRNPCRQIDAFRPGLLAQVIGRGPEGGIVRKCGIMSVVIAGGPARPGDAIAADLPALPYAALAVV